jgi:hypothetical protein
VAHPGFSISHSSSKTACWIMRRRLMPVASSSRLILRRAWCVTIHWRAGLLQAAAGGVVEQRVRV